MTPSRITVHNGMKFVFAGDSITQWGMQLAPALGSGYPFMLACRLAAKRPDLLLSFVNAGIAGNTIVDLSARWERDVLALTPDLITIMIGVNDVRNRFLDDRRHLAVSDEQFREVYVQLIEQTRRRSR